MKLHYKQSQFEFFPSTANSNDHPDRPNYLYSSLIISIENLIVFSIVILMAFIFSFSIGVEKGKSFASTKINLLSQPQEKSVSTEKEQPQESSVYLQDKKIKTSEKVRNSKTNQRSLPVHQQSVLPHPPQQRQQRNPVITQVMINTRDLIKLPEDIYTVQVASFLREEHAQKEAMDLRKLGLPSLIVPKGSYSIVCVGQFSRKEDASLHMNNLKKKYKDCLVRRL